MDPAFIFTFFLQIMFTFLSFMFENFIEFIFI